MARSSTWMASLMFVMLAVAVVSAVEETKVVRFASSGTSRPGCACKLADVTLAPPMGAAGG